MKLLSNQKFRLLCAAGLLIVLLLLLVFAFSGRKTNLTNELVASKLEAASELTTARLTYNGLLHYEDGKIPLLTKKAFFMLYCAEVEAGIDLAAVDIHMTKDTLTLTLPEPAIQSIHIVPDSIQFYDESRALFNPDNKEDATEAISAAQADVEEKADIAQMLDTARNQTELLLQNLFADALEDRTLVIRYQ